MILLQLRRSKLLLTLSDAGGGGHRMFSRPRKIEKISSLFYLLLNTYIPIIIRWNSAQNSVSAKYVTKIGTTFGMLHINFGLLFSAVVIVWLIYRDLKKMELLVQNWACTYGGQPSPRHVQGLQTAAADRVKNIVISDWLTFLTTRQQTKQNKKKNNAIENWSNCFHKIINALFMMCSL